MAPEEPPRETFRQRYTLNRPGDDARLAQETVVREVEQRGFDPTSNFAIRLALEEAICNAFKHGNKNDPEKVITLECSVDDEAVVIEITDEGEGFDPESVPDPSVEENLEIPAGRGIVLMKSFMTEVQYNDRGNAVRMVYRRAPGKGGTGVI